MLKEENKKDAGENKLVYKTTLFTGILFMVIALERGLSINNIIVGSATNDISKYYAASAIIDSSLSSILMSLVSIWVLFLASPLKKLQRRAWWQGMIIGVAFTLFGAVLWWKYPSSVHLPVFMLLGLMLFFPLAIFSGKFRN
ncbi:MAG: hypothetical protein JST47_14880 [Bacteroidetes bacterium]|nr:hypothetical protein [Bacteroidota bacterium]MBS1974812.1 hypothetical protein [Bacteroidota bacterium]